MVGHAVVQYLMEVIQIWPGITKLLKIFARENAPSGMDVWLIHLEEHYAKSYLKMGLGIQDQLPVFQRRLMCMEWRIMGIGQCVGKQICTRIVWITAHTQRMDACIN